ncbi:MAG: GNAT family N-acetyltransferase [Candidatus Bipolaricaulota bacterium]|nr:GNAT family N-acetyltransferase [Candidatus Bipolaricaulota bacterium]
MDIQNMKIRPYQKADLPKLVGLFNEVYRGSHEFIPYTEEKLRAELEEASSILVVADEQGRILGLGLLRREWHGEEIQLCAQPGQQKIEEQLLSAIESQARSGEISTVVDSEDCDRIEFFVARGYKPDGSLYHMVAELDQPRAVPVPQGYLLRGLKPTEEEELIEVVNAAYEGERLRLGALARWHSEDPAFSAAWVQMAEHKNRLVAAVVARSDRDFNQHYHAKRGYLGPAATLPAHQGKGLGKALTAQALNFLREHGLERASLYTWSGNVAALKVLKSLGFRVSHEWQILTKSIGV